MAFLSQSALTVQLTRFGCLFPPGFNRHAGSRRDCRNNQWGAWDAPAKQCNTIDYLHEICVKVKVGRHVLPQLGEVLITVLQQVVPSVWCTKDRYGSWVPRRTWGGMWCAAELALALQRRQVRAADLKVTLVRSPLPAVSPTAPQSTPIPQHEETDEGIIYSLDHSHGNIGCYPKLHWRPEVWRRAKAQPLPHPPGVEVAWDGSDDVWEVTLPGAAAALAPKVTIRHAHDPEMQERAMLHKMVKEQQPRMAAHAIGEWDRVGVRGLRGLCTYLPCTVV